jgi:hypothetical protein
MASKRKTVGKVDQFLLDIHPSLSDEELAILRSKYSVEDFRQLVRDKAILDPDAKKLVDEFKKIKGQ